MTKILQSGGGAINHEDLADMPDIDGNIPDHDARYYTETEIDTMLSDGTIDHTSLSNIGVNTHAQIDAIHASRMRVTKDDAQSIPNNALTKVQYNDEDFDNLGEYDNTTNYRFTATEAGYYWVDASLRIPSIDLNIGEFARLALYKNGAVVSYLEQFNASANMWWNVHLHGSDLVHLDAGEYLEIYVYQNKGEAVNTGTSDDYNYFSVHRLS